jgi:uncharacterized protein
VKPLVDRLSVDGPAGCIEVAIDVPATPLRGFAFIGHPHPLYGGTLDNKVTATLARSFAALGWAAVRPNFRGVGASSGEHDHGVGETADFLHLIDVVPRWPRWTESSPAAHTLPLALAGFSFGSFVAGRAAQALAEAGRAPRHLVLVGAAAGKWALPRADPAALVIHGEQDETIPLADVLDWARDSGPPVVVVPGADHFFHRRLTLIKRLVLQHLTGAESLAALGMGDGGRDE